MADSRLTSASSATAAALARKRVAVLMGGWSKERPVSLRTGAAVLAALRRRGVKAAGIDMRPGTLGKLASLKLDLAVIALHGPFGEDGRLQGALDILNIPYTGSGALASAVAMDKIVSKRLFVDAGVPTPPWAVVQSSDHKADGRGALAPAVALLKKGPVFVKPFDQGSAFGVSRVNNARALPAAVSTCFRISDAALVERYVDGRELTVGILGERALPVVEIVPEHAFYDYHSKYAKGGSRHLVPAPLSAAVTRRVQDAALRAYRALGCQAYGRVDVLIDRRESPWVLEVNTIPGMTATSLLPDAARAAGLDFDELVFSIIRLSLEARRRAPSRTR